MIMSKACDVAASGGALQEEIAAPEFDAELVAHIARENDVGEA